MYSANPSLSEKSSLSFISCRFHVKQRHPQDGQTLGNNVSMVVHVGSFVLFTHESCLKVSIPLNLLLFSFLSVLKHKVSAYIQNLAMFT